MVLINTIPGIRDTERSCQMFRSFDMDEAEEREGELMGTRTLRLFVEFILRLELVKGNRWNAVAYVDILALEFPSHLVSSQIDLHSLPLPLKHTHISLIL